MEQILQALIKILEPFNPFKENTLYVYKDDPKLYDKPRQTSAPVQTQQPVATPQTPYQHYIPTGNPEFPEVPQSIAQAWMEILDKDKVATSSAQMMSHPWQQTYTDADIARTGKENWNKGENPNFDVNAPDWINDDKSTDIGLTRTNSNTINEMLGNPFWKNRLVNFGISSLDDLRDYRKNIGAHLAQLEYANWKPRTKDSEGNIVPGRMKENPNYNRWYAAPLSLKNRTMAQ